MSLPVDFNSVDERLKQLKVISVERDKSQNNKCAVTLELPIDTLNRGDLEQFFNIDDVKKLAIENAEACLHKQAGWSDISRMFFYNNGEPVTLHEPANAVRVIISCLSMP